MSGVDEHGGTHASERRGDDVIHTTVRGRVTSTMIRAWSGDWERLHPEGAARASVWFFDAIRGVSYTPDAVSEATRLMMRLKGLRAIVIATKSTIVKLGATIVQKTLRATTGVDVQVFDSLEAAEAHLARVLEAHARDHAASR